MRKGACIIFAILLIFVTVSVAGCGEKEETGRGEEFLAAYSESETAEPSVSRIYACEEEYKELADFLAEYYRVPQEYRVETRYYYNYMDLNDDGINEIFAVIVGEHTQQDNGDPALLLAEEKNGGFTVIKALDGIRTPVFVCEQTTDGWHDFIYKVYGLGAETGYKVCRYRAGSGYEEEAGELLDEMPLLSGTQILSNNLIDDLDQGRYLTLSQ